MFKVRNLTVLEYRNQDSYQVLTQLFSLHADSARVLNISKGHWSSLFLLTVNNYVLRLILTICPSVYLYVHKYST